MYTNKLALTNCSMVALVCLFRYFEVFTSPSEDEFFTVEAGKITVSQPRVSLAELAHSLSQVRLLW
jgi:hypothetical protein